MECYERRGSGVGHWQGWLQAWQGRLQAWQGRLQQAQLTRPRDRFGAALDLQFAKNAPIVPFDRTLGEEQLLANLLIRASLRNKLEDFDLSVANGLVQRLSRRGWRQ